MYKSAVHHPAPVISRVHMTGWVQSAHKIFPFPEVTEIFLCPGQKKLKRGALKQSLIIPETERQRTEKSQDKIKIGFAFYLHASNSATAICK